MYLHKPFSFNAKTPQIRIFVLISHWTLTSSLRALVLALVVHLEPRKGLCSIRLVALLSHTPGLTGDTAPQHWTRHSAHNYYSGHYVYSHYTSFNLSLTLLFY